MSKNLTEKCPFKREGTASRALYMALVRSSAPLDVGELCRRTKLPEQKVRNLILAYSGNKMHDAPLRRAGVRIVPKDGKYHVESCAAQPNAKRPPRGDPKGKPKKAKPFKKGKAKATPKKKAKPTAKKPIQKVESAPVPVPAQETTAVSAATASQA